MLLLSSESIQTRGLQGMYHVGLRDFTEIRLNSQPNPVTLQNSKNPVYKRGGTVRDLGRTRTALSLVVRAIENELKIASVLHAQLSLIAWKSL